MPKEVRNWVYMSHTFLRCRCYIHKMLLKLNRVSIATTCVSGGLNLRQSHGSRCRLLRNRKITRRIIMYNGCAIASISAHLVNFTCSSRSLIVVSDGMNILQLTKQLRWKRASSELVLRMMMDLGVKAVMRFLSIRGGRLLLEVLLHLLLIVLKLLRNLACNISSAILRLLLNYCRRLSPISSISTVINASSTNQKWIVLAHRAQMISKRPRSRCDRIVMHQILIWIGCANVWCRLVVNVSRGGRGWGQIILMWIRLSKLDELGWKIICRASYYRYFGCRLSVFLIRVSWRLLLVPSLCQRLVAATLPTTVVVISVGFHKLLFELKMFFYIPD